MERLIRTLKVSWSKPMKCEVCSQSVPKSQLYVHYQYCPSTPYFKNPKFKMGIGDFMMLQRVLKQKIYFLKLIFSNLQKNQQKLTKISKIGLNLSDSIPQSLAKGWENEYLSKTRLKYEKWSRFNSYSAKSIREIQEIIFYTPYKKYDPAKVLDFTSSFNREFLEYKHPSLNLDLKISFRSCSYSEDHKFAVLSDCSKIFVYCKRGNGLICKITDNLMSKTTLIEKYGYLVYQDKQYTLVFYNLKNQVQEGKIKLDELTTLKYLKVTSDSKYLVAKMNDANIFVWEILTKILCHKIKNCEELNFVITTDNFELLLFDSDIRVYNFFCEGKGTKVLKNNKKITFLTFVNKFKMIAYSDGEFLRVANYPEFSILFQSKTEEKLFYLTKDHEYLIPYTGKCFEFRTERLKNSKTFNQITSTQAYGFVTSNFPNIFYSDTSLANNNQVDHLIKSSISQHKLIDLDDYIENYAFNNGFHFLLYLKKGSLKTFIFDTLSSVKNVKMIEFKPSENIRYFNNDFFIFENKNIFNFWSLESKKIEFCMEHLKISRKHSEKPNLKNFAFSKGNHYAALPNKNGTKVSIIKIKILFNAFSSDIPPVVDTWQNYLGFYEENQIKIYSIKHKKIENFFPINPSCEILISFKILNSDKLLLLLKNKIKLIDLFTNKVLASGNIDLEDKEPQYEIRENYVAVSNSDEVFVISLKNDSLKMIKLSSIRNIVSLDVMENKGYLVISGLPLENANQNEKFDGLIVLIIALNKLSVVKKISSENGLKPIIYNDFIITLTNNSDICAFQMTCDLQRSDLSFKGFSYQRPLLNNKYLTFINKTQLLVIDLLNNFNKLARQDFESSYSIEITKNEKFFLINKENYLEVYDSSLKLAVMFVKYFKIKYTKIQVLKNDWIILFNQDLKFKILNSFDKFSFVSEFKVKNEPAQDVEIKMFEKFIFIGGKNFFSLFDVVEKSVQTVRVCFYHIKESGLAIYKKLSGKMKCLSLNTGNIKAIFNRNSDTLLFDVLDQNKILLVYDPSNRTGSLEQAS